MRNCLISFASDFLVVALGEGSPGAFAFTLKF